MIKNIALSATLISTLALTPIAVHAVDPDYVEHITARTDGGQTYPVKLKKDGILTTKASFKPPVDIIVEAKTDSTNIRLSYAADQLIFNWEVDKNQLRVDGGPANGQHKFGAGLIPTKQYVTIRWLVLPTKQSVFVNGQLRFEHIGDYSSLDKPLSIFSSHGSEVMVRSIKVKQLPAANE